MQIDIDMIDIMLILQAIDTEIDFLWYYTEKIPDLKEDTEQCIDTYKNLQTHLKQYLSQEKKNKMGTSSNSFEAI